MSGVFQKGKDEIAKQNLDVVASSDVVLILMSDSFIPTFRASEYISDINADEIDCDGYTQGYGSGDRKTPTNRTFVRNLAAISVDFRFDDVTWSSLGGGTSANNDTLGYVVLAEERTNDGDSPLIAWDSLQDDRSTNGSDITYSPDAQGMFQFE